MALRGRDVAEPHTARRLEEAGHGSRRRCAWEDERYRERDVQTQFTKLVQETQDYYQSIQEIQVIISEIAEESETFVNTVQNIQNQIHAISDVPDSDHISSQDILEKARQTEETTQEMSVIVNHNKENALEINNIIERFSWKNN